ncbi:MAG: phosphate transport system permease protein [Thermoplasmata archaeon]|nr:phosphate transport system permease protein [Thermoplasmata archaeon]
MTSLRRKLTNHGFTALAALALAVALVPLVGVTWDVVAKGAPAISWSFLTQVPKGPDDPTSGVGPAIQGTFVLTLMGGAIGVPLGVAAGTWLAEHGRNLWGDVFRLLVDALAAVPSIVMGIFVFAIVVESKGFSALAGGIALGLMVVPRRRAPPRARRGQRGQDRREDDLHGDRRAQARPYRLRRHETSISTRLGNGDASSRCVKAVAFQWPGCAARTCATSVTVTSRGCRGTISRWTHASSPTARLRGGPMCSVSLTYFTTK